MFIYICGCASISLSSYIYVYCIGASIYIYMHTKTYLYLYMYTAMLDNAVCDWIIHNLRWFLFFPRSPFSLSVYLVSILTPPFSHSHTFCVSSILTFALYTPLSHTFSPSSPLSLITVQCVYAPSCSIQGHSFFFSVCVRALHRCTHSLMPVHMPGDFCFHTCMFSHMPACRAAEREMHNGGFTRWFFVNLGGRGKSVGVGRRSAVWGD